MSQEKKLVTITINGKTIVTHDKETILHAANENGFKIPTLCHYRKLAKAEEGAGSHHFNSGSCRVCMVMDVKKDKLVPACVTPCSDGMDISINDLKVIQNRRNVLELILSDHPKDCLTCSKSGQCELQELAAEVDLRQLRYEGEQRHEKVDTSSLSIIRDMNKCIYCKRCVVMCNDVQKVGVLSAAGRGFHSTISTPFDLPLSETNCTFCGQCVSVCPTGALSEVSNVDEVWKALVSNKYVVVQTAPAIRVALGEEFGYPSGTNVTGKMVRALRQMGFQKVFDTNFAADLTIMEEAAELVDRIQNNKRLPILTSCCPGWVKYLEHQFNDLLDIPSSCKSPHEMFGSITKTYFAEKMGINPKDIVVVSVMPCLAKKYESARPELGHEDGYSDVDIVITTRELAKMIKEISIDFNNLEDDEFDNPFGESSGAGNIFASSGGVIEAALRTAYEWITGDELTQLDFKDLRGLKGSKEATVEIDGKPFTIGVVSGLGNANTLLRKIRNGDAHYDAIEIMACPGGCIAGGGQPYHHGDQDIIKARMNSIYEIDQQKEIRQSHKNPQIFKLYDEFLGKPYGEKAHQLLHTHYVKREKM
ncbi:MAG: 4Fe-4S binding protein [Erysipelothrix sp.]|nr:4Fe-4S binding protein [Erysipelothrix sp.]